MTEALQIISRKLADEGAEYLTAQIAARRPFIFLRFGDGFLECTASKNGLTCDLEPYTPDLSSGLMSAWRTVCSASQFIVGDWQMASFEAHDQYARYRRQWDALMAMSPTPINTIHFESLLLMRESQVLVDFYRVAKRDLRRKLYMGPAGNAAAANMLNADFLEIPMGNLFEDILRIEHELLNRRYDVCYFGAGMAGNIPVVNAWAQFPSRTFVNLGSALDPLFRGRSRRQQISTERAQELFADLL